MGIKPTFGTIPSDGAFPLSGYYRDTDGTFGKTDHDEHALLENYAALIDEIVRAKPASAKGRYLRTITLTTTMGPGVRVDPTRVRDIVEETAAVA